MSDRTALGDKCFWNPDWAEAEIERLQAEHAFERRERIATAKAGDKWRQTIKRLHSRVELLEKTNRRVNSQLLDSFDRIELLETVRGAAKALRGRFHSRPDIPEFAALDDALAAAKDKDDGWAIVTVAPHSSLEVAARQLVECDDLGHIGPSAWSRLRKALSMTKA